MHGMIGALTHGNWVQDLSNGHSEVLFLWNMLECFGMISKLVGK